MMAPGPFLIPGINALQYLLGALALLFIGVRHEVLKVVGRTRGVVAMN